MDAQPALVRPLFASSFDAQVALWVSRLSLHYPAVLKQFNQGLFSEELRQLVGVAPRDDRLSKAGLRQLLKTRVAEFERDLAGSRSLLTRNIGMLAELVELDDVQQDILAFAAMAQQHAVLCDTIDDIASNSTDAVVRLLSTALAHREADIARALQSDSPLISTRIVTIEHGDIGRGIRPVVPRSLVSALFSTADSITSLMSAFLEPAPRPTLTADSFVHLSKETELLTTYLAKARSRGIRGINILIYGPPGTGKTEYVRWLATRLRRRLYQVRAEDDQGKAITGVDRLTFFQFSQHFLQSSSAIILFDEIEDVFPNADNIVDALMNRRAGALGKLFINRLLETNPVPAIWVSNEVDHIAKAYLRRFDFSFEMNVPPLSVRRKILHRHLGADQYSEETIAKLAQQDELSPAQIEKAAKIVGSCRRSQAGREDTLLFVIENSMALLDQRKTDHVLDLAECSYRLDYLNPDHDVKSLVTRIKNQTDATGALCFYGAPGTGKTALAHYMAREMGVPILVRRASDILSPYVGETEQKIAAMFKTAKQEGSMLLLDEADSFLTERKAARHTWEVTGVNEMLTQMERFDGLFICSTNLMEKLDEASLRRFALKIKFDYLRPEQRWRLFVEQAKRLRRSKEGEYRAALNQLSNLTPGDFATVRRQAALTGATLTADTLIDGLKQECRNKRGTASRPIGFLATL